MTPSESIDYLIQRLIHWGTHSVSSLAKVQYLSGAACEEAIRRLGVAAQEKSLPFRAISLPLNISDEDFRSQLLRFLDETTEGLVSIRLTSPALTGEAHHALTNLVFLREKIAERPLRQVWWMLPETSNYFVTRMADLDSWFELRLTMDAPPPAQPDDGWFFTQPEIINPADARRRANMLAERARRALAEGEDPTEVAVHLVEPALQILESALLYSEAVLLQRELGAASRPSLPNSSLIHQFDSLSLEASRLRREGRILEARDLQLRILEQAESYLTHDHPLVLKYQNNLAQTLEELGDYRGAVARLRYVLENQRKAFGDQSPILARTESNLAEVLGASGQLEEALAVATKAVATLSHTNRPPERWHGSAWNNYGIVLLQLHRPAEAVGALQRALAIDESLHPPEPEAVAAVLLNLSGCYSELGDWETALDLSARALKLARERKNPGLIVRVLVSHGNLLSARAELGQAEDILREALSVAESAYEADNVLVARAAAALGRTLLETGDRPSARTLAQRAFYIDSSAALPLPAHLAEDLQLLGRVALADGDFARAGHHLRESLDLDRPGSASAAMTRFRLAQVLEKQGDHSAALREAANALDSLRITRGPAHPRTREVEAYFHQLQSAVHTAQN